MNRFHSAPGRYFERWLTPHLRDAVAQHPVVVLTGARQVGKSTLLTHAEPFCEWGYRTMDDSEAVLMARESPPALWADRREVVLDEVQKTPQVLAAVKQAVDTDPGLAAFLCGHYDEESLRGGRELGFLFETLIFLHLRVLGGLMTPRARLHHFRTRRGDEVDFVVEHGRKALGIGVKLAREASFRDTAGLRAFLVAHPGASGGLVVYAGRRVERLDDKVVAIPWTALTGSPAPGSLAASPSGPQ